MTIYSCKLIVYKEIFLFYLYTDSQLVFLSHKYSKYKFKLLQECLSSYNTGMYRVQEF